MNSQRSAVQAAGKQPSAPRSTSSQSGKAQRGGNRPASPQSGSTKRPNRDGTQGSNRSSAARGNASKQKARTGTPRRVTSVDGFRALAIIAVFLYHLDVTWLPSGHLGVVMFLVLTGYLATSSLLRKLRDGIGAIPTFWFKRLARIWPATVVMIALTVLACILTNHVLLTKARPDVIPGIGLYENISYILRNVSYFEQIGGPSPLTHLWYLGVDIQFNLVWPIIMLLFYAILPSHTASRRMAMILAIVSAVAMGVLYNPDSGVTRVYYGTDTRAFAPLVGAWLAYAMPIGRRPARNVRSLVEDRRMGVEFAGILSLALLVVGMVLLPDTSILLYRGGMMVAALLSAVVIATLVLPGGLLSTIFSLAPLRWLGSRSFGAYLWHYPLIQLFGAASNTAPLWKTVAVVVLTLILAELSYRLIEQPVSNKALMKDARERLEEGPFAAVGSPVVMGILALALVGIGDAAGMALIPEETLVPEEAIVSTGEAADKAMDLTQGAPEPTIPEEDIPAAEAVLHAPAAEKDAGMYDPVLIGDSVPGDAEAFWRAACPDGLLDSYVGRRPDQALTVLDEYLEQGVVGKIVIIQAFSNTPVTMAELDHMIAACGPDRIIYLVNVRIPESEQEQINNTIAEGVNKYDNVHLIDWHGLSEGQSDWLYGDGEHLTPTGQPIYINMLVEAIEDDFTANGGTVSRKGEQTDDVDTGVSVVYDNTAQTDTSTGEGEGAYEGTDETYTEDESAYDGTDETYTEGASQTSDNGSFDANIVQASAPLRILMLGNSFTLYNDMPDMVAEMTGAEVTMRASGGANLSDRIDPKTKIGAATIKDIKSGKYDYVVLQERTDVTLYDTDEYLSSLDKLTSLIRENGAEPVIYATWAYDDTETGANSQGITLDQMYSELQATFQYAATHSGSLMANVGQAFSDANYDKRLYAKDGKHPSKDGSKLAAKVIAQAIEQDVKMGTGKKVLDQDIMVA